MKQIFVGTFPLGYSNVDLYALPESSDGFFYFRPDDKSPGRIKIGLNLQRWDECVAVLLHETMEMLLSWQGHRFQESGVSGDHASYRFFLDHTEFTKLCQFQSWFVTPAMPRLAAQWIKNRAAQKKANP